MLTKPPTAIPFESIDPVLTPQGHRIRPLVDGRPDGNAPEIGICAGGLDVPPGFIANAHWHPETDVIVLVYDCGEEGALTLFGDELEYESVQHSGDLLPIQKGWAHTVVNLSLTSPIRAYEFRLNSTVVVDNPLLPQLQPIAHRRGREYLLDLHGQDAVEWFDTGRHLAKRPLS
jgi:aldehyde dehydrogenase (NAD+)